MGNRKAAEKLILQFVSEIDLSGYTTQRYKQILPTMKDEVFHEWMTKIRAGEAGLVVFRPPFKTDGITTKNNLDVGKKYGISFFEPLVVSGKENLPDYETPFPYMILDLPLRRQSQNLVKKISIPENNAVVDELTGQPTGASTGARISHPELQVLVGMNLEESVTELIKYRGGDRGGFNAYNAMMLRYGHVNLKTLENFATGVESTKTLKTILTAMHIKSTL
jgi:hypothetical protein